MVFDQPHGSALYVLSMDQPLRPITAVIPKIHNKIYYTFIDLKVHSHTEESESIIGLLDR